MRLRLVGRFASWPTPGRTWMALADVFSKSQSQNQNQDKNQDQGEEISNGQDQYYDRDQGPGVALADTASFKKMKIFVE